jgi:hypothetical protein
MTMAAGTDAMIAVSCPTVLDDVAVPSNLHSLYSAKTV